ncbi:MAG: hypothetical protein RPU64_04890 [Candidatus Sedimenticola sp. (ex Thyasira tokunagai)]
MNFEKLKRILITGNLLRFNPGFEYRGNQTGNIRWLAHHVQPALQIGLDLPTSVLVWSESSRFDGRAIYRIYDRPVTQQGFVELLNENSCKALEEYLAQHIPDDSLVIGFELPELFIKAFDSMGVSYVDIMMAPIRFMSDIVLGIRASRDDIHSRLLLHALTEAEICVHAGAFNARLCRLPSLALREHSAVLAGQVSNDVSLANQGQFIGFNDFKDEIQDLVSTHAQVYFKPHPYANAAQVKLQKSVLKQFGSIQVTNENIYHLLYQSELSAVCALTSSVVIEAPYFGVKGRMLASYPFPFVNQGCSGPGGFVQIYDRLHQPSFWAHVLADGDAPSFAMPVGILRTTIGQAWGADLPKATVRGGRLRSRMRRDVRALTRYFRRGSK